MNENNASGGKKIRALVFSALLISVVAGALFVPVMADSGTGQASVNGGSGEDPVIGLIIDPLPFPWELPWWLWWIPRIPGPWPTYPM